MDQNFIAGEYGKAQLIEKLAEEIDQLYQDAKNRQGLSDSKEVEAYNRGRVSAFWDAHKLITSG